LKCSKICFRFQIPVHGRESTGELVDKAEKLVKKRKLIICLDEVDQLKDFDILYTLARSGFGLILASTHYHALMNLPSRIKSCLALTEVEFPQYRPDELFDILKDRVDFSFKPNSISKELIRIASVMAEGDARVGLEILRRAGKKAEDRGKDKVTIEEIKDAAKEARKFRKSPLLSKLNEHERIIYEILERKRKMPSGELYEEYCRIVSKPVVDRAYRNYMEHMIKLGLVKAEGFGRWRIYEIVM
jgi:Cdc6-like AAA superfamily ATPase